MAQVENTLVKPRADALYLGIAAQAADSVLLDGELSAHYHAWANLTGVPYDELIAVLTSFNKDMTADVTGSDGDRATVTPIAVDPEGYVEVKVNSLMCKVANGNGERTTSECYFSDDGGVSAKAFGALAAGDLLYWNGSVAGFQLTVADRIDFLYEI